MGAAFFGLADTQSQRLPEVIFHNLRYRKRLLMRQSSACVYLGDKKQKTINTTKIRVLILLTNGCT